MERNILTRNAHLALMLLGVLMNVLGPTLPFMIAEYEISQATAGTLFTLLSLGRLCTVFFGGNLSDSYGRKPLIVAGSLLLATSMLGFALSHSWLVHLLFIFVAGLSYGLLDIAVNALIADIYPEERGAALNLLHAFFGVGSCLGALVAGFYLSTTNNWRVLYILIATCALIYGFTSFYLVYPKAVSNKESKRLELKVAKPILVQYVFWILALTIFAYTGVSQGIMGWLKKYLNDTFSLAPIVASIVHALYNLGLSGGRLVCSRICVCLGYKGTIILCTGGAALSLTVAIFSTSLLLVTTGFMLTGFFLAGLFPTVIAMGSDLFPNATGTVSGLLITSASLGGMFIPAAIGAISDYAGMLVGMATSCLVLLLVTVTSLRLPGSKKAGSSSPPKEVNL